MEAVPALKFGSDIQDPLTVHVVQLKCKNLDTLAALRLYFKN